MRRWRIARWQMFVLAWAMLPVAVHRAGAETRLALVIGNAAYRHVGALANPVNDARAVGATLRSVGFDLVGEDAQINVTRAGMEKLIREFGRRLTSDTIALFYYAGHGIQLNGVNWLVPVDANIVSPADVKYELVDTGFVLDEMTAATNRLNLVFLDACRDNPFAAGGLRGIGGGLAQIVAPAGTIVGYATQPGAIAYDGEAGNSPYSAALMHAINQPGVSVLEALNQAGLEVQRATGGRQQPWLALSPIQGQFAFTGAIAKPAQPVQPSPTRPAVTASVIQPDASPPPRIPERSLSGEEAGLGAWIRDLQLRVMEIK